MVGAQMEVCQFKINGTALFEQFFQPLSWIWGLQQWALLVVAQTLQLLRHRGVEEYDESTLLEEPAVLFSQDGASACGQYDPIEPEQVLKCPRFPLPESFFAFNIEDARYVDTCAFFNVLITVVECAAEPLRQ